MHIILFNSVTLLISTTLQFQKETKARKIENKIKVAQQSKSSTTFHKSSPSFLALNSSTLRPSNPDTHITQAMDWFSWLSRTGLESSLVYEYSLAFAHNELEEEDIIYFNHEFLQSMGISIAKHRLEILKLARKEKGGRLHPVTRLLAAIKKTKRCFANYIHSLVHRDESALVVVPRPSYGQKWRGSMLKRNKRLMKLKQGKLMLTGGCAMVEEPPIDAGEAPVVQDLYSEEKVDDDDDDDGYWSTAVEEIRWDTMFQDMKPT